MESERILDHLDRVADSLENKGLLQEAIELDTVSNSIEASTKEAMPMSGKEVLKTTSDFFLIQIPGADVAYHVELKAVWEILEEALKKVISRSAEYPMGLELDVKIPVVRSYEQS